MDVLDRAPASGAATVIASTSLYDYPEVYYAVRQPTDQLVDLAEQLITRHAARSVRSVMDPTCGPGNWLAPFAARGLRVAGNDISQGMVDSARQALNGADAEIVRGDMRELAFSTGPFDLVLELAGTVGLLHDADSIRTFLGAIARNLSPSGLVLLNFPAWDGALHGPHTHQAPWTHGPVRVLGGGTATVTYEVLSRDPATGVEHIRRTVRTFDVRDCPPVMTEEYGLRTWTPREIRALVEGARDLSFVALYDDEGRPLAGNDLHPGRTDELFLVARNRAPHPERHA